MLQGDWLPKIHQGRLMPFPTHRAVVSGMLALALTTANRGLADVLPWQRSQWFDEQAFTAALEPAGRVHVNAPIDETGRTARGTRILVYALPNGNTIEQTLGCKMAEGLDWHYDIQHVAAQVRLLRSLPGHVGESLRDSHPRLGQTRPSERIVLVCAEAGGLSWPNWRRTTADANMKIADFVGQWRRQFGTDDCRVTLAGHSGGGSFMFGVMEASDDIPDYIDRIVFLDANYSFDAAMHAEKLQRWLAGDASHRLIVLAYDDREITLDGKKVVGPTGGTFRATGRMRDALREFFHLDEKFNPPFHETAGLDGRIQFFVHHNPENKILHTVLVGEMNGLLHAATLGTPLQGKWGKFGGPRAYTKWIQPEPEAEGAQQGEKSIDRSMPHGRAAAIAGFPARPADAQGGREFVKSLEGLGLDEREAAILREITRGNFPDFLRNFKTVPLHGLIGNDNAQKETTLVIEVMPDYLAIGGDGDFVRIPMTPQTAQKIADALGCTLPTRKMVDAIDTRAEVRLAPHPLTRDREAVATFFEHHQIIETQRSGRPLGSLVTGIKKDIVLSPRIFEKPQRLAIYGWRQLDGAPIQPLTIVHWNRYVDYSHGARLVRDLVELEGQRTRITDLLADPARCGLVSDEGVMNPPRYPADN
jgi:pimeloyl-ACP methyl ester carboxylesterase